MPSSETVCTHRLQFDLIIQPLTLTDLQVHVPADSTAKAGHGQVSEIVGGSMQHIVGDFYQKPRTKSGKWELQELCDCNYKTKSITITEFARMDFTRSA